MSDSVPDIPDSPDVSVRWHDTSHALDPALPFTFGRSPESTAVLDPDDVSISRHAGRIEHDGTGWWVVNVSSSRQLALVDEFGFRSVLPPGRRQAVEGPVRVLVEGTGRTHELLVTGPPPSRPADEAAGTPDDGLLPTSVGEGVMVSAADRASLVALFAGYLEQGERYDPYPKSYAAAAARLGWPRTTLVKRIEYLRTRLTAAGVPNLTGWNALANLAEYALTTGLVTREDLRLIVR